jgi:S1-C subfamily serine protease
MTTPGGVFDGLTCPGCKAYLFEPAPTCLTCERELDCYVVLARVGDAKRAYAVAKFVEGLAVQAGHSVGTLARSLQAGPVRLRSTLAAALLSEWVARLRSQEIAVAIELQVRTTAVSKVLVPFRLAYRVTLLILLVVGLAVIGWLVNLILVNQQVSKFAAAQRDGPPVPPAAASAQRPGRAAAAFDAGAAKRMVVALSTNGGMQGSGFFFGGNGLILTNAHVVEGLGPGDPVMVRFMGQQNEEITVRGSVVRVHDTLDLALVRCAEACTAQPVARAGESMKLDMGSTIYAIGSPIGLDFTLSKGIVSSGGRLIDDILFLQTDASVNPGNSGGPVFNEAGEVVGIVTLKVMGAEGIGFVLPIEYATQGRYAIMRDFAPVSPVVDSRLTEAISRIKRGEERAEAVANADPFAGLSLVTTPNLELTTVHFTENGYAMGMQVEFHLRRPVGEPLGAEDTFALLIARPGKEGVATVDFGRLKPTRQLRNEAAGTTDYYFSVAGRLQSQADLKTGDIVAIRMADSWRSDPVTLQKQ